MAPCHLVPFHFPYFPFHFLHSLEARTPHPGVTLIFARSVALPRCSFCSLAAVTFRHFPLPNMHHQSEQFRAERVTSQASGRVSNEETLASCRSPLFVRSDFVFFPHKRTKEATRGLGGTRAVIDGRVSTSLLVDNCPASFSSIFATAVQKAIVHARTRLLSHRRQPCSQRARCQFPSVIT